MAEQTLKSEQLSLFNVPVIVGSYQRSDGTVVQPHVSMRRKANKPTPTPEHHRAEQHPLFEQTTKVEPPEPAPTVAAPKPAPKPRKRKAAPSNESAPLLPATVGVSQFGAAADAKPAERKRDNALALAIIESKTDAQLTPEDVAALARYSGRGGIGDHLNEFYTRPDVADAMWTIVHKLGVATGRVCEPSCGTGVFLHTAPAGVTVSAAELDAVSSRIARALHPEHEVNAGSFEAFAKTDPRLFDAVIGNVPFGLRGSFIKDDKPDLARAEQYFVDTALDKTRADGIVALIVPTGIMDGANNRSFREDLLRKGQFIAAHRLPNTAFGHSHTEVTSDIVLFRRRDPAVAQALKGADQDALKKLGIWDEEFLSGGYFGGRGAALVYGSMEDGWRAKAGMGHDITVAGDMEGVAAAIADWAPPELPASPDMAQVLDALPDDVARAAARRRALRTPYEVAQVGDMKTVDGVTYILQGEPPRWRRVDDKDGEPAAVISARELGERIERFSRGDGGASSIVADLEDWIAANGNPRDNADVANRAGGDKALHRMMAAVNADGSFSDLLTGRSSEQAGSFDTAAERMSLDAGSFSPAQLALEIDAEPETVEDTLFASDRYASLPDGGWQTMGAYLTGELWPKLDAVRERLAAPDLAPTLRAKLEMQARRLDETIAPRMLDDVEVLLNSAWVPLDVVTAFFNDSIAQWKAEHSGWSPDPVSITFDKGLYSVNGGMHHMQLVDQYLNRTGLREDDRPFIDEQNELFKRWLLDSEHRDRVEDIYNRAYTGFARQSYSDEPIEVPGLNPDFNVKRYHWRGVRRMLDQRAGIIAADVGVGKTPRGLIIARLLKAYGRARKPAFVIPKSILAKWVKSAQEWFPDARIMVIGETYSTGKDGELVAKADSAATRNRKLHEVAQNDYDFVFFSGPAWNEIDLSPERKNDFVSGDFWVQRGDQLGNAGDKRVRRAREAYEQSVAGREFQKRSDVIYFDDLGIDALFTDEAHAYKNLYAARARYGESPKFLGGSGLSNRALDSVYKCRYVLQNNNDGNVYDLTATPTKNSPLEIYSMLCRSAPQAFERMGIRNSEEFLDRFCEFERRMTLGVNGTVENALCTTGFKNLDELRGVMARYIDRETAEDVGLVLPEPEHVEHLIDMNDDQREAYASLREMAEKTTASGDATGDAHIFSIMDKMSKAATDLELLDAKYAGAVSLKIEQLADTIRARSLDGGNQLVFCEFVGAHEKIKAALIARGFKPDEIGIINATAAKSSLARQRVAEQLNEGKIKVAIGNKTMEEGLDMQENTSDIHHVDVPWDPSTLQQRNGRGRRQGNRNDRIRIHRYLSRGSFDGYRYQTVSAKRDWMNELWGGANRVDNLAMSSAPSREDMLVMLAADPDDARRRIAENKTAAVERMNAAGRAEVGAEFARFRSLSRSYGAMQNKSSQSAVRLQSQLAKVRRRLEGSQHFEAKDALDHPDSVVIDPQTGVTWRPGMAIEVPAGDAAPLKVPGRWVVEAVSPDSGGLRMRAYGSEARSTIDASALRHGVKPAAYDAATERAEMAANSLGVVSRDFFARKKELPAEAATAATEAVSRAALARIAEDPAWHESSAGRNRMWQGISSAVREALPAMFEEELQPLIDKFELNAILAAHARTADSIKQPKDLQGLPDAFIEHHRGVLQKHLRRHVLAYTDGHSGTYGLVVGGEAKAIKSYRGRDALADEAVRHLLPTASDRQMTKDAFKKNQREMQFDWHHSSSTRRGNHSTKDLPGVKLVHPEHKYDSDVRGNPMRVVVEKLYPGLEAEAKAEIRQEALTAARAAPSFRDAFKALVPTIDLPYGGMVKWPADDIRLLADKAIASGVLRERVDTALGDQYAAGAFDLQSRARSGLLGYALAEQLQPIDPDRARELVSMTNEKAAA